MKLGLFTELKRRNALRAGVLYAGAVSAKFKLRLPKAWQAGDAQTPGASTPATAGDADRD